jgi:transglutaminase-like putative cysteine protease
VTFAREKRLLLGWLALLAPLPLPFNEILGWGHLVAYEAVVAAFLWRAARDPGGWLPVWAMNVLALAYLPYFVLDLRVLSRGRLVAAVTHLLLFTVLVKLFALRRERDKWQTAIALFFLFVSAMATSVHPTIVLYLLAYLVLGLLLFTRFAQLHLVAGFTGDEAGRRALLRVPMAGFLAAATVAVLVLAAPLFAFMPRVRNPIVSGSGQGFGTLGAVSGFADEVTLDTIGTIRQSQEVAMRLRYSGAADPDHEMRYRGGVFDRYRDGAWRASRDARGRWAGSRWGRRVPLAPGKLERWVEVFLRPVTGSAVPVPVEGLVVEQVTLSAALYRDEAGIVRRVGAPGEPFEYRVGLGMEPTVPRLEAPPGHGPAEVPEATLDRSGASPRVAELAARVAGDGSPLEQARRLERHLMTEYAYSLDFLGRGRPADPIEAFLFDWREGHCEYFASAMVLMLRSRGIPARLATGFLGADHNPLEDYWVVRQSNAHAWVEAYLPDRGWTMFDPTPAGGRPAMQAGGLGTVLGQAWDYLLFRWDRYVLTYGFNDQVEALAALHGLWRGFLDRLPWNRDEAGAETAAAAEPAGELGSATTPPAPPQRFPWALAALVAVLAAAGALLALRARRPLSGADAYRQLRRRARQAGLAVREADPPLHFGRSLAHRFPEAAAPGGEVVALYVEESFGERHLARAEAARLREALLEAARVLKKAG